jgi:hydrogenase maturation protease
MTAPRILVAGIGNIFLGDDGFGVEVVQRLARRPLPDAVRVVDFGIRAFDLACALLDGYDGNVLVDAIQRGGTPGTLYVIEPELPSAADTAEMTVPMHGLHPAQVLQLVQTMGGRPRCLRLVGCEPATLGSEEEPAMALSAPVAAAVDEAVRLVEELVRELLVVLSSSAE